MKKNKKTKPTLYTTDEFAPESVANFLEKTLKDFHLSAFVIGNRRIVSRTSKEKNTNKKQTEPKRASRT